MTNQNDPEIGEQSEERDAQSSESTASGNDFSFAGLGFALLILGICVIVFGSLNPVKVCLDACSTMANPLAIFGGVVLIIAAIIMFFVNLIRSAG